MVFLDALNLEAASESLIVAAGSNKTANLKSKNLKYDKARQDR
jgi:hypothetical protein